MAGRFYAEFSPNRRGYVNRPTVIVGENGPEYVIPNEMLQNPEVAGFVNAIEASRLKGEFRNPLNMPVPGRALGGYVMTPTNTVASSSAGGVTASVLSYTARTDRDSGPTQQTSRQTVACLSA